jgi:hypothetical protein
MQKNYTAMVGKKKQNFNRSLPIPPEGENGKPVKPKVLTQSTVKVYRFWRQCILLCTGKVRTQPY